MTKKELWNFEFKKQSVRTADIQNRKCCICKNQFDKRDMKEFRRFEEVEYICRLCFLNDNIDDKNLITKNEILEVNINQIELENQNKMLKDTICDLKALLNEITEEK